MVLLNMAGLIGKFPKPIRQRVIVAAILRAITLYDGREFDLHPSILPRDCTTPPNVLYLIDKVYDRGWVTRGYIQALVVPSRLSKS